MLDAVGRKLFSSGFKKAISSGVNSARAHKVSDAVANGAFNITKGWKSCCKRCNVSRAESCRKWIVGKKRSIQPSVADPIIVPQERKLDIVSLIDGSGIVLD